PQKVIVKLPQFPLICVNIPGTNLGFSSALEIVLSGTWDSKHVLKPNQRAPSMTLEAMCPQGIDRVN
ncbi:unnamed protein product, partial [Allacma fusca]